VSGPELKSKWVGESEENLRRVFRQARQAAPSVVVFDEIDAFAHQRGTYIGSGVEHSMVNQLLTEMDGFRRNEMIFVVGTTNYLESLDGALLRPGRFEFVIEMPAPDADDRAAIARIYNARLGLGLGDDLVEHLVRRTEGMADREKGIPFSGDHLHAVCRALKRQQLRDRRPGFTPDDIDRALQRKTRRPIVLSPEEERVIAVHEAGPRPHRDAPPEGHAARAHLHRAGPRGRPRLRAPRGARAAVRHHGGRDARGHLRGLGGQVAERMVLREVSGGAHADLQQANAIARAMVEQWGMSRGMGPRVVTDGEREHGSISPTRRDRMDAEVESILREELTRCESLLRKNAPLLEALWTLLLEKKVLDGAALRALAEPKGG
jgi:cell division protease FtsH